jgi:hypothetical protein
MGHDFHSLSAALFPHFAQYLLLLPFLTSFFLFKTSEGDHHLLPSSLACFFQKCPHAYWIDTTSYFPIVDARGSDIPNLQKIYNK